MAKSGSGGWSKRHTSSRSNSSKSWNQRSTLTTNTNKGPTRSTSIGTGSKGNRTRTTISTNLRTGKTTRTMTITNGMGTKRINLDPKPKKMKTIKVRKPRKTKAWKPKRVSRSRSYNYNYNSTPTDFSGVGKVLGILFLISIFINVAIVAPLFGLFLVLSIAIWWGYNYIIDKPAPTTEPEQVNDDIKQRIERLKEVHEAFTNKHASEQDPEKDISKDSNSL